MAADQGNEEALIEYAVHLANGHGVEKDDAAARRYCKMAADRDVPAAQLSYGALLATGRGVGRDEAASAPF